MSPQGLSNLLFRNSLIDVPKMMDIAALYWTTSDYSTKQALTTMFRDVVALDPQRFQCNLSEVAKSLASIMVRLQSRLEGESGQKTDLSRSKLQDIVYAVMDFSVTLFSFLSCYPPAGSAFHEQNLTTSVISFYDKFFPKLQDQINLKFSNDEANFPSLNPSDALDNLVTFNDMSECIMLSRKHLLMSVRQMAGDACLRPLLDESLDIEKKGIYFDTLSEIFTFAVTMKFFYKDYARNYPIETDIQILANNPVSGFSQIDPSRIHYLSKLLQEEGETSLKADILGNRANEVSDETGKSLQQLHNTVKAKKKKRKGKNQELNTTANAVNNETAEGMQEVELVSLISGIKDILPNLGEGYIQLCLESFAYNTELTLNALLMEELPQEIKGLNKSLTREDVKGIRTHTSRKRSQNTSRTSTPVIPQVIASRSNIFDGDEFDIHRNKTIDLSRVHVGKKDYAVVVGSVEDDVKKRTLLLQEKTRQEEEDEELRLMAEMGITDPDDFYVG